MSLKGIIMFLGMNNTRVERKILIILDFENGFLPTYLPQCGCCLLHTFPNQTFIFEGFFFIFLLLNERKDADIKARMASSEKNGAEKPAFARYGLSLRLLLLEAKIGWEGKKDVI